MKIVKHIARIIVGITFIFSGFVKGIDPWGSAYKFTDYFNAMGLEWLLWAAFPLGVLLAFAEFAIGVGFLFNVFIRLCSWLALLFMIFFTGLTLWIALDNPVTDCGCFGDALILTNWETFYKNIVLILLAFIVFRYRNNMDDIGMKKISYVLGIITVFAYIILTFYSYNHLPVFDFRPYKTGVNIPEAMAIPENAPQPEYENVFYYSNKKTGEIKKFTEENYPWQDTLNWQFNNMESILIKEGYEPPIHDFRIETPEGDNIIDFFIYDENYVFMIITYDLKNANTSSQNKINELANWVIDQDWSFIGLTSSLQEESEAFVSQHNIPYPFFNCDEITLKTIVRSNPGLMIIKNGNIVAKYHYNDIPSPGEFQEKFMNK
ncbi:MAG: DoxX family protein [Prolixibacteraceae bacterium]|nr:DoxX family protein [Prolixibacteraceae bacterium]